MLCKEDVSQLAAVVRSNEKSAKKLIEIEEIASNINSMHDVL